MRYPIRCALALIALISLLGGTLRLTQAQEATPAAVAAPPEAPSQAATGPGGAEFAYDGMLAQHYGPEPDGTSEPTGYWLFEPTGRAATERPVPRAVAARDLPPRLSTEPTPRSTTPGSITWSAAAPSWSSRTTDWQPPL